MMTIDSMTMPAASLGAVLALLLAWAGMRHVRRLLRARCAPLEEALRVYNSANVVMGKHVTALETDLCELRQRLAAIEGAGLRARLREPAPAEARPEESSVAEQRLSMLIRSRLGGLRPG
jgi:hypothetical protein